MGLEGQADVGNSLGITCKQKEAMDYKCMLNVIMISIFEIFCNPDFSGCFTKRDAFSLLLRSSACAFFVERLPAVKLVAVWLRFLVVPHPLWCQPRSGALLSPSGQHGLPKSSGGRVGAVEQLQEATSERLDSVTLSVLPTPLPWYRPRNVRDAALWHRQQWLHPFGICF